MTRHGDPDDARDRHLDDVDDHAAGIDVGDAARDRIIARMDLNAPRVIGGSADDELLTVVAACVLVAARMVQDAIDEHTPEPPDRAEGPQA